MWPIGSPAQLAGSWESSFCTEERHALYTSSMNTSGWGKKWAEHCYVPLNSTQALAERNQGWEPTVLVQWFWKLWPWGNRWWTWFVFMVFYPVLRTVWELPSTVRGWDKDSVSAVVSAGWVPLDWNWDKPNVRSNKKAGVGVNVFTGGSGTMTWCQMEAPDRMWTGLYTRNSRPESG